MRHQEYVSCLVEFPSFMLTRGDLNILGSLLHFRLGWYHIIPVRSSRLLARMRIASSPSTRQVLGSGFLEEAEEQVALTRTYVARYICYHGNFQDSRNILPTRGINMPKKEKSDVQVILVAALEIHEICFSSVNTIRR